MHYFLGAINTGGSAHLPFTARRGQSELTGGPVRRAAVTLHPQDTSLHTPTHTAAAKMPKCPNCQKEVYFAEKVTSLGKDWHRPCLKCEKCKKTLSAGSHAEHEGKPYCHKPCYAAMFGPGGFGRGGAESHKYN